MLTSKSGVTAPRIQQDRRNDVEIRVHGIGDHTSWSALGSAPLLTKADSSHAEVALPPVPVDHGLELVNWSRTSHSRAGWLWYLAFPFTLINLAHYMTSPESRTDDGESNSDLTRTRVLEYSVDLVSLLATAVVTCWSIALSESVLQRFAVPGLNRGEWRPALAAGVPCSIFVMSMLARPKLRPETHLTMRRAGGHAFLVVAVGVLTFLVQPAQIHVSRFTYLGALSIQRPSDAQLDALAKGASLADLELPYFLDPMALVAWASLLICILLGFLILMTRRNNEPSRETGAVLALMLSIILLNAISGAVLTGTTEFLQYLSGRHLLPFGSLATTPAPDKLLLLARIYEGPGSQIVPLLCVALLLCLSLGLTVAARLRIRPPRDARGKLKRKLWIHDVIANSRRVLNLGVPAGCALCLFALSPFIKYVRVEQFHPAAVARDAARVSVPWALRALTISGFVTALVIAAALIFGMRFAGTRKVLGSIADVAGFWPVRAHPLAGRSYRDPVVRTIASALVQREGRTTVLVGHSQGSVLCAWTLSTMDIGDTRPLLVTCGSPIGSLYAEFFPENFNTDFAASVEETSCGWVNYWRATDPIAAPFGTIAPGSPQVELLDPRDGPVLGHGDYWIDPCQTGEIRRFFADRTLPAQRNGPQ